MKAQPTRDEVTDIRRRLRAASRRAKLPRSATRSLIRLDTDSIRKKVLQAHRKAERALEKLKADLKRYQERDVPGFRAWIHRTFGPLLTRQREVQHAIDEKLSLIGELEELAGRYGLSLTEAYRKLMWRRAHPEEAEAEDRTQEEARRQQAHARSQNRPQNDSAWDDAVDDDDIDDDELDAWLEEMLDRARKPCGDVALHPDQKTVTELYHNIVRRLHPDHHGQFSEARAALWHEAQEAYHRQDLNALHSILARCDDGVAALGAHTPVSLILRMTQQLAKAARSNRSELQRAKHDVAWRYEDRVADRGYIRKIERDLLEILSKLQWTLDDIKRELAELERAANRHEQRLSQPKRKAGRSQPSPHRPSPADVQDEFPF